MNLNLDVLQPFLTHHDQGCHIIMDKLMEQIKIRIKTSPSLYKVLQKVYHPVQTLRNIKIGVNALLLQYRIKNALKKYPSVFFVQVGANDGKTGDPLHEIILTHLGWTGIFIEPVKYLFVKLKLNYGESNRFIFENVAIGDKNGTIKFYYIAEEANLILNDLPHWYDQLGTFEKKHILNHFGPKIEPFIIEDDIKCVPLDDILYRNKVHKIDLLHIDTEGFDYKILSQVNFKNYHPVVILFEHKHLLAEEKQKAKLCLNKMGYRLYDCGGDYLAISKG